MIKLSNQLERFFMWADSVDQWLEKNAIRGGHSSSDLQGKMFSFAFKICFYMFTMGIGYFLVRILRTKDAWYYEDIYSRKNNHQNIEAPDAKKLTESILEKEMITLGKDEEILFLIKDQSSKNNGILFTSKRMIYNLVKPNFTALVATNSGQMMLADLAKKMNAKPGIISISISANGEEIGKIDNSKPKLINDFLDCIRKSIANAAIA
jgi:hypothetical protein